MGLEKPPFPQLPSTVPWGGAEAWKPGPAAVERWKKSAIQAQDKQTALGAWGSGWRRIFQWGPSGA